MKIVSTIQPDSSWTAIDADSYEAESDVNGYWSRCPMGEGATEADAVTDLLEQMGLAPEQPPREPAGQAIASIVRVLDDLIAMARSDATYAEIAAEEVGLGQIISRAQLVLSFIDTRKPSKIRVVR